VLSSAVISDAARQTADGPAGLHGYALRADGASQLSYDLPAMSSLAECCAAVHRQLASRRLCSQSLGHAGRVNQSISQSVILFNVT